jgi:uncharacterized damage-inducible protein DinB
MSPAPLPEAWLRGPVSGVSPYLQPAAHALIQAREEVVRACSALTAEQLLARPAGAPSLIFHLQHLAGSTQRLLTYARGESLSEDQRQALETEGRPDGNPDLVSLLSLVETTIERAIMQLRETPEAILLDARTVGRLRLPSNVLGLLMHAAEHASRHVGQIVTTARIVTQA